MSLAHTTNEFRATLLQFGSMAPGDPRNCRVRMGPDWIDPTCPNLATWWLDTEDAHAGVSYGGDFEPAETLTHVCDEHMRQIEDEPRLVFSRRRIGDES